MLLLRKNQGSSLLWVLVLLAILGGTTFYIRNRATLYKQEYAFFERQVAQEMAMQRTLFMVNCDRLEEQLTTNNCTPGESVDISVTEIGAASETITNTIAVQSGKYSFDLKCQTATSINLYDGNKGLFTGGLCSE